MQGQVHGRGYPAVGRCIYCGSTEAVLSREHIVPKSLGGALVLQKASCGSCADITKKFEQTCARTIFGPLRIRLGLPTSNPDERPDEIETVLDLGKGVSVPLNVAADKFPAVCMGALMPSPGLLIGVAPTNEITLRPFVKTYGDDVQRAVREFGSGMRIQRMHWESFFGLLAKIGHSYAVAEIGVEAFRHFLPPLILGKSEMWPYYIGGDQDPLDEPLKLDELGRAQLHASHLKKVDGTRLLVVTVTLFRFLGMPRYHVVVGEERS